jgi:outer membrane immunogenic protein
MQKGLAGAVAFLAAVSLNVARAADMPVKAPPPAPAPVASWTGFYLGGGYGYGLWDAKTETIFAGGACAPCEQNAGGRGWLGVVTAGYDYQFNDKIVAGVLADFDFGSIEGNVEDPGPFWVATTRETAAWTVGARAGWLLTPTALTYVNGGWTQAHFSGDTLVRQTTLGGAIGSSSGFITPSTTLSGWFVGGGLESAVTYGWFINSPGWFWRTEYRFASYNGANLPETNPVTGAINNTIRFQPYSQTITTELIYKFNAAPAGSAAAVYKAPRAVGPSAANWSGVYLGVGGGYGLWDADTTVTSPAIPGCTCGGPNQTAAGKGPFGVVTAGYDYQFSAINMNLVAGVFGDFNFASIKGNVDDPQNFTVASAKETDAWAAGVRGGWLMTPTTLTYFSGGWSGAHFQGGAMTNAVGPTGVVTPSTDRSGWFLGGGFETSVASGWFWRNEYRYASYDSTILIETPAALAGNDTISFRPYVQTFATELVYKFNWPR